MRKGPCSGAAWTKRLRGKTNPAMVRDPVDQFAKIIATYATLPQGILPASLDRDFKRLLKAVPTEYVAHLLEWTIQSPQTPSFNETFELLYRHSSKRIRAELVKTI